MTGYSRAHFVEVYKAWGKVTGTAEPSTVEGDARVTCACGEVMSRWVTPESPRYHVIFSTLLASPN